MTIDTLKDSPVLGKDFLTYLCYKSDEQNGLFKITGKGTLHLWLGDKIILEDDAATPQNSVTYTGRDFTAEDLKQAIKSGKIVSEAQFKIDKDETAWSFTIRARQLDVVNMRMSTPQFKTDDSDSQFYTRMMVIDELNEMLDELYYQFLHDIGDKNWKKDGFKKFLDWVNR